MTPKGTFYAFIAAVVATMASGFVYAAAKSRLAALGDAGEGTAEEIRSAVGTSDISFLVLIIAGIVTVILFLRFVTLRRRNEKSVA
jgi:hypothetical protein